MNTNEINSHDLYLAFLSKSTEATDSLFQAFLALIEMQRMTESFSFGDFQKSAGEKYKMSDIADELDYIQDHLTMFKETLSLLDENICDPYQDGVVVPTTAVRMPHELLTAGVIESTAIDNLYNATLEALIWTGQYSHNTNLNTNYGCMHAQGWYDYADIKEEGSSEDNRSSEEISSMMTEAKKANKALRDASITASINKCEEVQVNNNNTTEVTTMESTTNFNMADYDDNADINAMLDEAADEDMISIESNNSPVSCDKTENTTDNNTNTISQEETTMTNSLVTFGSIANKAVNFNGRGINLAVVLASIIYKEASFVAFTNESAEAQEAAQAKVEGTNAVVAEKRAAFVANFETKLGFIDGPTLDAWNNSPFRKSSMAAKANVESLYSFDSKNFEALDVSENNAALIVFATLAAATVNLIPADRAALIGLLFNVTAVGTKVSNEVVTIDMEAATVAFNGRVLKANKFSCFGVEKIVVERDDKGNVTKTDDTFVVLDGAHSVFMFAMQAFGGTEKQMQTAINLAVKLFAPEHNYGHKPDSDDISFFVRANLVYANSVASASTSFPSFSIKGGKQNPNFLSYVLGQGVIATSDKTNTKFVTIGVGAEATGIGWNRETNTIMTVNDAAKPSKLINRPAANNYDCADIPNRVASNFGFQLSNGEVARTKGRMMKVAYTNSILLTAGSGTGTINPNTTFVYSVDKNLKFPFQFSVLGAQYVNNEAAQNKVIDNMLSALEAKKGTVYAPGETILSLAGGTLVVVANTEVAGSVELLYASVKRNVLDNNEIDIVVHVRLIGESQFVKTRRFATKFTTTPYNVGGLSQPWEIILNNECTKGQGALLEMFANETGERYMNNNTGEFVTPAGDVINLLDGANAFQTWKETSTRVETIEVVVAKSVYNNIKGFGEGEFTVVSEDANTVTVQEVVSVIYGTLVFDVEISTPLESVSTSAMTLESAAAVYLQSRKLGDVFLNEVNAKTDAYTTLASSFAKLGNEAPSFDLLNVSDVDAFIESVGDMNTIAASHKDILSQLHVLYPYGVKFNAGVSSFCVSFQAVRAFGSFSPLNGSAVREAAQVMNFVLDVIDFGATNAQVLIVNAARAFDKILNTAVSSKNVLKKPTRSGRLVYGKVRTGLHPILNSVDGVPTVVVNANCPIVKMLGIKEGNFVGFARTPMPFLGAGRIKFTSDSSVCDIAHVLLDPYVWHSLCEGKRLPR